MLEHHNQPKQKPGQTADATGYKRRPDLRLDVREHIDRLDSTKEGHVEGNPRQSEMMPHAEHGYRGHSYWLGLERLGSVGLPLRGFDGVYIWRVGALADGVLTTYGS